MCGKKEVASRPVDCHTLHSDHKGKRIFYVALTEIKMILLQGDHLTFAALKYLCAHQLSELN